MQGWGFAGASIHSNQSHFTSGWTLHCWVLTCYFWSKRLHRLTNKTAQYKIHPKAKSKGCLGSPQQQGVHRHFPVKRDHFKELSDYPLGGGEQGNPAVVLHHHFQTQGHKSNCLRNHPFTPLSYKIWTNMPSSFHYLRHKRKKPVWPPWSLYIHATVTCSNSIHKESYNDRDHRQGAEDISTYLM